MQVLKEKNKVPPGGWKYELEGHTFRGTTLEMAIGAIREYYFSNKRIPPKDLDLIVQDQICKRIPDPENKCGDATAPTAAELLGRVKKAAVNWVKAGMPIASDETIVERRQICYDCSFWQGEAVFGLGRCGSCGCTGLKLYAATEKCPQGKWEATA